MGLVVCGSGGVGPGGGFAGVLAKNVAPRHFLEIINIYLLSLNGYSPKVNMNYLEKMAQKMESLPHPQLIHLAVG